MKKQLYTTSLFLLIGVTGMATPATDFSLAHPVQSSHIRLSAAPNTCNPITFGRPELFIPDQLNSNMAIADYGCEPNRLTRAADGIVYFKSPAIQILQCYGPLNPQQTIFGEYLRIDVLIVNRGDINLIGNGETLALYWSAGALAAGWPGPWLGGIASPCNPALRTGGPIAATALSNRDTVYAVQQTGGTVLYDGLVISTFWPLPASNPATCQPVNTAEHYCFLARLLEPARPNFGISFTEGPALNLNVKQNNNIAWNNVVIYNYTGPRPPCINPAASKLAAKGETPVSYADSTAWLLVGDKNFTGEENCPLADNIYFDLPDAADNQFFKYTYTDIDLGSFWETWIAGGMKGKNIALLLPGQAPQYIDVEFNALDVYTNGYTGPFDAEKLTAAIFPGYAKNKKRFIRVLSRNAGIINIGTGIKSLGTIGANMTRTRVKGQPPAGTAHYDLHITQGTCQAFDGEPAPQGGNTLRLQLNPDNSQLPQTLSFTVSETSEARTRIRSPLPIVIEARAVSGKIFIPTMEKGEWEAQLFDGNGRPQWRGKISNAGLLPVVPRSHGLYYLHFTEKKTGRQVVKKLVL